MIVGDGNCYFRALSFILHKTQERHRDVRRNIVEFLERNQEKFQQFLLNGTFEEHVTQMRREGVWATQVELYGAASLHQVPIHICSPDPGTQKYRWLLHKPLDQSNLLLEGDSFTQMRRIITPAELCPANADHFDCILDNQNHFPTSPPQLGNTCVLIDIG